MASPYLSRSPHGPLSPIYYLVVPRRTIRYPTPIVSPRARLANAHIKRWVLARSRNKRLPSPSPSCLHVALRRPHATKSARENGKLLYCAPSTSARARTQPPRPPPLPATSPRLLITTNPLNPSKFDAPLVSHMKRARYVRILHLWRLSHAPTLRGHQCRLLSSQ